jgi:signal transduction histidine kinase
MASQPLLPPITARLDRDGRLVAADPPLLALQQEAGGKLGRPLAVPQLAAIARLAFRLGVAISRPALAASEQEDIDLWVRAEPDEDGITLTVERWVPRMPARPRWASQPQPVEEVAEGEQSLSLDRELKLVSLPPGLARRLGLAQEDGIGRPLTRLLRPVEDDDGNLPLLAALAARSVFRDQPAIVRDSGEAVLLDGTPREQDGRFDGYTVRLRTPASALPLGGLPLDDLLKEPLAAIIDEAQEIAGRSEGPLRSDYAGYGADIGAAARHLLGLLASISSSGEGESLAPDGEVIDLAELVLDAAGLVQPQAAERGVMLDIGGLPRLAARGQARAVTQILVNLIGNAVRFSPTGGEVSILLENGTEARVTVSDSGPGVAPSDRSRIFERFEQAGSKPGGAGLGLTISRRLAREMGGDVELLASPVGATFRLSLPAA